MPLKRVSTDVLACSQNSCQSKQQRTALCLAHTVIDGSHDAIATYDLEGSITSFNPAAERLFKLQAEQAVGSNVWNLVPAHLLPIEKEVLRGLGGGNAPTTMETQRLTSEGELLDVLASISPLCSPEGHQIGFISAIRDITEQKRMLTEFARLDRLYTLSEMAAGVTHEVRNPLTTVRGYLQLLRPKEEFAMYRFHFDLMIKELDRINELITQFLSLGQHTRGEKQLCSLCSVVKSLLPLIQAEALLRDMTIETHFEPDLPLLWLHEKEIKQLLLNLLQNGMDAMENGGRVLNIDIRGEYGAVVLCVEDQGCGIPLHVMERLFTPFVSTKEYGTGLGLAVCRKIAEHHQAEIKVQTDQGGTSIRVIFPVRELNLPPVG